jgi:hypothetical protein
LGAVATSAFEKSGMVVVVYEMTDLKENAFFIELNSYHKFLVPKYCSRLMGFDSGYFRVSLLKTTLFEAPN